mgnify:CR=1 FL=1
MRWSFALLVVRLVLERVAAPLHQHGAVERARRPSPSWFLPVVRTVTMPASGRDFDSRLASTSTLGVERVAGDTRDA